MPLFNGARYLANINSAINPMIYAAMNDDFKQNLRLIYFLLVNILKLYPKIVCSSIKIKNAESSYLFCSIAFLVRWR